MAFDYQGARAAGYSDEEISAYLQAHPELEREEIKKQEPVGDMPPPPQTKIPEIDRGAEMAGVAGLSLGGPVMDAVKEIAPYAAGAYGVKKIVQGTGIAKEALGRADTALDLMRQKMATDAAREARMAQRPGFGGQPQTPGAPQQAPRPVAPQAAPQAAPAAQAAPRPVAPQQPSLMQRGGQLAQQMREIAASRVAPVIPQLMKGAGAVGAMLYSPELNAGEDEWAAEQRRLQGRR